MYEDKTPEAIKAELLAKVEGKLDTREGSFADDMAGPVAIQLSNMYIALNAVQPIVWVDETSGEYLDAAAKDLGIATRKAGTKAQVMLTVTGTAGYTIPAGTTFLTVDGYNFDTTAAATIPEAGSVSVPAQAQQAGSAYNVAAGTILYQFSNSSRITAVTNQEAAAGGADIESDASLYMRIEASRQKPATSGNVHHYEQWALETPGVGAVKVTPVWNGPGTVKVLIADENRQPVDGQIVAACAAHIEEERPVGAAVTVVSAEAFSIAVSAAVSHDSTVTAETIEAAFRDALAEYFKSVSLQQMQVLYNRVGALLIGMDGVIDYSGLTLNGQEESVVLADGQVPVVGEVTFSD